MSLQKVSCYLLTWILNEQLEKEAYTSCRLLPTPVSYLSLLRSDHPQFDLSSKNWLKSETRCGPTIPLIVCPWGVIPTLKVSISSSNAWGNQHFLTRLLLETETTCSNCFVVSVRDEDPMSQHWQQAHNHHQDHHHHHRPASPSSIFIGKTISLDMQSMRRINKDPKITQYGPTRAEITTSTLPMDQCTFCSRAHGIYIYFGCFSNKNGSLRNSRVKSSVGYMGKG